MKQYRAILSSIGLILTSLALVTLTQTNTPTAHAASEFFVSPTGSASNPGTKNSPWNIETAFKGGTDAIKVQPGDTVWLLGGKYGNGKSTSFTVSVAGTQEAPVKIRQYPGQRAVIDGGLDARGPHVWFWGFEITNSYPERYTTESNRPIGLKMWAPNQKSINLKIYNTGRTATSFHYKGEQYGGIYFGNGFYDTSQSNKIRGGSVYANIAENTPAETNLIANTISFRNWNSGVKVYTEWEDRYINGFRIEGNAAFDAGQQNLNVQSRTNSIRDLAVEHNYTYHRKDDNTGNFDMGYKSVAGTNAVVRHNYFVSGTHGYGNSLIYNWQNLDFSNNILVTTSKYLISEIPNSSPQTINWNNNAYYYGGSSSSSPFKRNATTYNFSNWKNTTGHDTNSTYANTYPAGEEATRIFYRTNKYFDGADPVRGNLIVYNWSKKASVVADLSPLGLAEGETYEIKDAQNYVNTTDLTAANPEPLLTGTYSQNNKTVTLPMNLTTVAAIPGKIDHFANSHTAPEFAVFVVERAAKVTEPPAPQPKRANITLTASTDKRKVKRGETVQYTVTYKNNGEATATNTLITYPVPSQTTYRTGSATNNGTLSQNLLRWNIGNLAPNTSGEVSFQVTVN